MYVGNRAKVDPYYWDTRVAGKEVTILNPDFASGIYIEVMTAEGESELVETGALTLVKNPLDL